MRHEKADTVLLVLIGFLIRIIIGTFTINWDFLKVTSLTTILSDSSISELYKDPLSLYPLLTYYTRYFFIILVKPFLSASFWTWKSMGDLGVVSDPYIFRNLFLLKIPFIILELASALIFSNLVKQPDRSRFLKLWVFNPVSLYAISAFSNVDVFPVFFIAICFYFLGKEKFNKASFFLGIAAAYKFFPALILPFIIFRTQKPVKALTSLLSFSLPFILTQLPAFNLPDYWKNSLLAGANRVIFTAATDIGHGKMIVFFVMVYLLMLFKFSEKKMRFNSVFPYFFPLIPVFTLAAFNVQWVYWILPILIYYRIKSDTFFPLFIIYCSYFSIILLSQAALHIGMLAPVIPPLWTIDRELIAPLGEDAVFLTNIFYTIFSSGIIYVTYRLYKSEKSAK